MEEARRTMDEPHFDLAGAPAAGAAARFLAFLDERRAREARAGSLGARLGTTRMPKGLAGDELVPRVDRRHRRGRVPHARPRVFLRHTQEIVNRYLVKALDDGHAPATPCDLFATEGGTAAMCLPGRQPGSATSS